MSHNSEKETKKVLVDIFAGFCSGIAVTVVGHPFETLKVRLQTQPSGKDQIYSGLTDCIKKTYQWEGLKGFYKGVSSPLVGQLFLRSAMFLTYGEYLRRVSHDGARTLSYLDYAIGGSVTWTVGTLIECPLQLASSQIQVEIVRKKSIPNYVPKYTGVFDFVRKTFSTYGLRGMYQGYVAQCCRNIPGGMLHFGLFEYIRREYARRNNVAVEKVGFWVNMFAGSAGGFFFWLAIYPVDVIKSSIQADSTDPAQKKYQGMIDCAKKLYAEGGPKRFSKGLSACLMRAAPANAVLLTVASMVREYLYAKI